MLQYRRPDIGSRSPQKSHERVPSAARSPAGHHRPAPAHRRDRALLNRVRALATRRSPGSARWRVHRHSTAWPAQNGGSVRVLPDPRITQRDGREGYGRARQPHPPALRRPGIAPAGSAATFRSPRPLDGPGWRASPGSPEVSRHPARSPAVAESSDPGGLPAGAPARPRAVTRDQLHRQRRRATCSMHDGRGCQRRGNPGRPCRRQMTTFLTQAATRNHAAA